MSARHCGLQYQLHGNYIFYVWYDFCITENFHGYFNSIWRRKLKFVRFHVPDIFFKARHFTARGFSYRLKDQRGFKGLSVSCIFVLPLSRSLVETIKNRRRSGWPIFTDLVGVVVRAYVFSSENSCARNAHNPIFLHEVDGFYTWKFSEVTVFRSNTRGWSCACEYLCYRHAKTNWNWRLKIDASGRASYKYVSPRWHVVLWTNEKKCILLN